MMVQTRAFSFFEFNMDPRFTVVTRPEQLEEMERFIDAQPIKAFDYETSGTAWWKHARPCGIAFSAHDPSESRPRNYYVPYRHITGQYQLPAEMVVTSSKRILENPDTAKIAHHIKFDEHMAHTEGITVRGERHDTMVLAHMYDENTPKGLKMRGLVDLGDPDAQLHDEILQTEITKLAKFAGMTKTAYRDQYGYAGTDIFMCGAYGAHDTAMTFGLYNFYKQAGVIDFYERIYPTEMRLTQIIGKMERTGVQIDVEYLQNLHARLLIEKAKAEALFFQSAPVEWFNLGSDDMLRDFLLKGLRLPLTKRTKKGENFSVDEEVLSSFLPAAPYLEHVLRWKDVEKKISTYTASILDKLDEHGILHGDFQQIGTVTGRLSCRDPNLQNIPSDDSARAKASPDGIDPESIKRAFIIQRIKEEAFRLFNTRGLLYRLFADYSQVELRVLAGLSRDPRMIDAFLNGRDIHTETEMAVFGTEDEQRRTAKIINFGLCIAEGSLVLTKQDGEVPIERVQDWHLVWDGAEWVSHDGLVCRGEQEVIGYDGIEATPDHEVYTEDGDRVPLWQVASSMGSRRIAVGAVGGVPVRYAQVHGQDRYAWQPKEEPSGGVVLRSLWEEALGFGVQHSRRQEHQHPQRKKVVKVYDLLNAGPRHRFTVNGKIVSNSYCMTSVGFARQAGIGENEAEAFLAKFFEQFPRIEPFRHELWGMARANGNRFNNPWGRTRRLPQLSSPNKWERLRAERQAIATLIQGTAAEMTKETMVRVADWLEAEGLQSQLVQTVHDEVQIDGPMEEFAYVANNTKRLAEDYDEFHPVGIVMDLEASTKHWAAKTKLKAEA